MHPSLEVYPHVFYLQLSLCTATFVILVEIGGSTKEETLCISLVMAVYNTFAYVEF